MRERPTTAVASMSATDPRPKDHLITRALRRELDVLAPEVRVEGPLDAAEAPERLARDVMDEIRRQPSDDESADGQAERVNDVLRGLGVGDFSYGDAGRPPRVLQGARGVGV